MKKLSQTAEIIDEVFFFCMPFFIIVGSTAGLCDDLTPRPMYKFIFYGTWGLFFSAIILMIILDCLTHKKENEP